jgi:hypothetical protein
MRAVDADDTRPPDSAGGRVAYGETNQERQSQRWKLPPLHGSV